MCVNGQYGICKRHSVIVIQSIQLGKLMSVVWQIRKYLEQIKDSFHTSFTFFSLYLNTEENQKHFLLNEAKQNTINCTSLQHYL